ncbi:MAG: DUF1002 domain-containing protein [Caryophanon sp.]|nr:DUF1002 domain-containing protein [Caryophanon sp.]
MKKVMTTITAVALTFSMMTAASATTGVIDEKLGVPIVVYGANLTADQKETVKNALEITSSSAVEEITVSGQDLVKYIKDGNPNARMFSSAKITQRNEGEGLVIDIVTPSNITQITSEVYASAMLTAGIENALVEVAAPNPVTGHSALVGIYKAYEVSTGEKLDTERTDVANDELSIATQITENAGIDEAQVAELLTSIKQQIAELNPATREDVEQIVSEQLSKFQIELSEADRQLLTDLMDRISNLNIDFDQWSQQLSDLSKDIEEKFGTFITENEGFWESVKTFFKNLMDTVSGWFS